ncbi:hemagglutinin [Mycoplasmopsis synoviae]|uniref:hemagglutinin n=1 Tax=Mycoplasmopsis synoviae TaxID=2109 RepID=UPI0034DB2180
MPKIVTTALPTTVAPMNREYDESPTGGHEFWKGRNKQVLDAWFAANQDKLSLVAEQLTKKLGEEKFKNMVLSNPTISWDEVKFSKGNVTRLYLTPKVTFNLAAKEEYEKSSDSLETVTLTIRNLYKAADPNTNLFATQGASSSAAPGNTMKPNDATTIEKVNVYLNYTGPSIVLDAEFPQVGNQNNTSLNGTSNVTGAFNNAFRGLLFTKRLVNPLMQSVINYVNKFDPKFPAAFVTNATNGVTITKVQKDRQKKDRELRPGNLEDLLYNNNVFLQQMKNDTEAVYFAVTAIASNNWLNTFLIKIPLTKFVRPISVLEEQTTEEETQESQEGQENQEQESTAQTKTNSGSK